MSINIKRKSIKEINKFLEVNINRRNETSTIKGNHPKDLTLQEVRKFKETVDYLNETYLKITQTLRN